MTASQSPPSPQDLGGASVDSRTLFAGFRAIPAWEGTNAVIAMLASVVESQKQHTQANQVQQARLVELCNGQVVMGKLRLMRRSV